MIVITQDYNVPEIYLHQFNTLWSSVHGTVKLKGV